jgi:hypothetical protein
MDGSIRIEREEPIHHPEIHDSLVIAGLCAGPASITWATPQDMAVRRVQGKKLVFVAHKVNHVIIADHGLDAFREYAAVCRGISVLHSGWTDRDQDVHCD